MAAPIYEVSSGRIRTWSLEIHAVDHCNLQCASCCTLSPFLPPHFVALDDLESDLAAARSVLAPRILKVTGGEPLLHPRIADILATVRASGIAEIVSLTTNGFLATKAPAALFDSLDRMTLSLYASAPLSERALAFIEERCERHEVLLTIKPYASFQRMTPDEPLSPAEARDVHRRCWLRERCHLLHRGRLFTCTRPPHLVDAGHVRPGATEGDGIRLDGADLLCRALHYLQSDEPLVSCASCLGGTGPWDPHRQEAALKPRRPAPRRGAGSAASPS